MKSFLSFHLMKLSLYFGLLIAFSLGLDYIVQNNASLHQLDSQGYEFFIHHFHNRLFDLLIYPFNFNFLNTPMPTYYLFLNGLFLLYLAVFKRTSLIWALVAIIIGSLITDLSSRVDSGILFRQRPFVSLPSNITPFGYQAWVHISSFPSGHVRETTLFSTIIYYFLPKLKVIMIIFILFISFSRVYIGAHFPTDVIAAILIGYFSARLALAFTDLIKTGVKNERHLSR